jgi:hypothetical protein
MAVAVETKNPEHMSALRRRGLQANEERRRSLLRCPACYAVKDHLQRGFTCSLSRCPRVFANIQPPSGSQPAVRVNGPS